MNTKSYGIRTDKAMKTIVKLERLNLKIYSQTLTYLSKYNLTFSQFKVLEVLYHRGDLNVSSITKLTMSTPGNITVVIRNLQRDDYITSVPNPDDKRASILTITQKGTKVIEKVFPNHAKNLHNMLDGLNDDELDTFYNLINKVYKTN